MLSFSPHFRIENYSEYSCIKQFSILAGKTRLSFFFFPFVSVKNLFLLIHPGGSFPTMSSVLTCICPSVLIGLCNLVPIHLSCFSPLHSLFHIHSGACLTSRTSLALCTQFLLLPLRMCFLSLAWLAPKWHSTLNRNLTFSYASKVPQFSLKHCFLPSNHFEIQKNLFMCFLKFCFPRLSYPGVDNYMGTETLEKR